LTFYTKYAIIFIKQLKPKKQRQKEMRTSRARRHDYLRGEPQVDLMPIIRRIFEGSPARSPENRRPWVEATGGQLKGLELQGKKRVIFPLEIKRWWDKQSQSSIFCFWVLVALAILPLIFAIIDGIFALLGRQ